MNKPKIGWWAAYCCELDLHQIKDVADLVEHLKEDEDGDPDFNYRYWPTKEAALEDLETAPKSNVGGDDGN